MPLTLHAHTCVSFTLQAGLRSTACTHACMCVCVCVCVCVYRRLLLGDWSQDMVELSADALQPFLLVESQTYADLAQQLIAVSGGNTGTRRHCETYTHRHEKSWNEHVHTFVCVCVCVCACVCVRVCVYTGSHTRSVCQSAHCLIVREAHTVRSDSHAAGSGRHPCSRTPHAPCLQRGTVRCGDRCALTHSRAMRG